jgi:ribosomal protein S18 acetylase RimI-like enzyme
MMEALMAWGVARRAQVAFLQVEEGNGGGRAFYRALGFGEAHRYWYRVPARPRRETRRGPP